MRVKVGKKEYLQNQKGENKRRRSAGRGELKKLREGRDGTKSTPIHSVFTEHLFPRHWGDKGEPNRQD